MKIESRTVGLFEENCYLVIDDETDEAVLIDPGDEPERLVDMVRASGARLTGVWLTHAHVDHIGGISGVRRAHAVDVHLHPKDRPVYDSQSFFAEAYGLEFEQPEPPDADLVEGDVLHVGKLAFTVRHVPGHSPGHVIFIGNGVVLGGDILFAGSVGRTDLPLSDPAAMAGSLELMKSLPPETVVYPGHGPSTTIGAELRANPFLNGTVNVKRNAN